MNEFNKLRDMAKGKKTYFMICLALVVLFMERQGILTNIESNQYMSWIEAGGAATLVAKLQRLVQYVYASVPT